MEENHQWNQPPPKKKARIQKTLPSADFYGKRKTLTSISSTSTSSSSWNIARTKLRRKWRRLSQQHEQDEQGIDVTNQGVYTAPPPPWKEQPKQQLAFDLADQNNTTATNMEEDLHRIFSIELNNQGKRSFVSTPLRIFWNYYSKLRRWQRSHYEIIRENTPCRLYFDLEFYHQYNLNVQPEILMEEFFYQVNIQLQLDLGICIERNAFLDLDSSTEKKFSRHVVVHMPNDQLWLNNIHVGQFVRNLAERCQRDSPMLWLMDHKGNGQNGPNGSNDPNGRNDSNDPTSTSDGGNGTKLFFADLAVYTKNRAFRLYLSSKKIKASFLLPAASNQFPCDLMDTEGEYQYFCSSLASGGVDAALPVTKRTKMFLIAMDNVPDQSINRVQLGSGVGSGVGSFSSSSSSATTSITITKGIHWGDEYEDLVHFIERRASRGGSRGIVRKLERQDNELLFHITKNNFCERIGRQHKSNHVYYIVHLKTKTVTQRCFDIECRGYSAPFEIIPEDMCLPLVVEETPVLPTTGQEESVTTSLPIQVEAFNVPVNVNVTKVPAQGVNFVM